MDFKVGDQVTFHVESWAKEGPARIARIYLPPNDWDQHKPVIAVTFPGGAAEHHFWKQDIIPLKSDYDEIMEMQTAYENASR